MVFSHPSEKYANVNFFQHFPRDRDEHKKYLKPTPRVYNRRPFLDGYGSNDGYAAWAYDVFSLGDLRNTSDFSTSENRRRSHWSVQRFRGSLRSLGKRKLPLVDATGVPGTSTVGALQKKYIYPINSHMMFRCIWGWLFFGASESQLGKTTFVPMRWWLSHLFEYSTRIVTFF